MGEPARNPPTDATLRTAPPLSRIQLAQACWVQASTASTLTSNTLRTAPRSASIIGPYCGLTAALLTRQSSRPKRSITCATAACWCSGSSAPPRADVATPVPSGSRRRTASSSSSGLRAVMQTLPPRATNSCAIPSPMPRVAPVTSAALPVKSPMAAETRTRPRSTAGPAVHTPAGRRRRTSSGPGIVSALPHPPRRSAGMDPHLTMQGNLVADPTQSTVASGHKVTRFRIAANGRRFDQAAGDWVNTDTVYMSVSCWRQLGDNVMQSLRKGDTVVVHGRLTFREYEDANGGPRRHSYEIDATSVAPALSRYVAQLGRPLRELPAGDAV